MGISHLICSVTSKCDLTTWCIDLMTCTLSCKWWLLVHFHHVILRFKFTLVFLDFKIFPFNTRFHKFLLYKSDLKNFFINFLTVLYLSFLVKDSINILSCTFIYFLKHTLLSENIFFLTKLKTIIDWLHRIIFSTIQDIKKIIYYLKKRLLGTCHEVWNIIIKDRMFQG